MKILEAKNLTKRFGKQIALDNVSFSLEKGEILGLLGRNGAGKTTTIQMLLSILTPTSGRVSFFGKDLTKNREEILEQVNFSSTYTNLPWNLTVRECLSFISLLYSLKDRRKNVEEVVSTFRLEDLLTKKVGDLSAGQTTRVNLAKSFINKPKVLLLDEPTASLDPEVANYVRQFLLEERERHNTSIIITSHNMAEVEEVCDRVIFIDEGRIVADDTPKNLARSIKHARLELLPETDTVSITKLCDQKGLPYKLRRARIIIEIPEVDIPVFLKELNEKRITYIEISIEKATLEDYFLEVAHRPKINEAI